VPPTALKCFWDCLQRSASNCLRLCLRYYLKEWLQEFASSGDGRLCDGHRDTIRQDTQAMERWNGVVCLWTKPS